tara:strand:+ start:1455 stop:2015 length:561 start_codon:yes stop_codon:yes gene_type:complete
MYHKTFPALYYWVYDIPNFAELQKYVDSKKPNGKKEKWVDACKIDTIFIDKPDFLDIIKPSIDLFTNEAFNREMTINISFPWINHYTKGCFQEVHDHKSDVASVFFLNEGKDFSEFFFYNRNNNSASLNFTDAMIYDEIRLNDKFYPGVKSGQVIFFPGTMLHGVTMHNSDVIRKTVSCNFSLENK